MRKTLSFLLLAAVGFSCAPARLGRPAWLLTERDTGIDENRYFLAAASAADEARARELAAEKLRQAVRRSFPDLEQTPPERGAGGLQLTGLLNELTPQTLRSFRLSDGSLYAVLLGLEKAQLAGALNRLWEQFTFRARESLRQALELLQQSRAGEGLSRAVEGCLAHCRKEALEKALGLEPTPVEEPALSAVAGLLGALRLKLIRAERVGAESDGKAVFVVGAYLESEGKSEPVGELPLAVLRSQPPADCVTSELGVCWLELTPAPAGPTSWQLGLSPSPAADKADGCSCLEKLLAAAPVLTLSAPAAATAAPRLLVLVRAQGVGGAYHQERLVRELGRLFSERGYQLVPREAAAEELAMAETIDEALPELRRLAERVLVVDALSTVNRSIGGRLFFCRCEVGVRLLRPEDGAVLFRADRRLQVAGNSAEKACRRALETVLREWSGELQSLLEPNRP